MRRPSPATAIATTALFVALSGTAYAATGGNFILGKPNTATSVSSLSNSAGTALSLSSKTGTPPLSVSNSVQVPKLNASLLDGKSASSFVQGSGNALFAWGGPLSLNALTTSPNSATLVFAPASNDLISITADCDTNSTVGAQLTLNNFSGGSVEVTYHDSFGDGGVEALANFSSTNASSYTLNPDLSTIQVVAGTKIVTFIAQFQENTFGNPDVCTYSAQAMSNK